MRKTYNKLVRDRIPEIIQESGKTCAVAIMAQDDYRQALLDKLVEESLEARQTQDADESLLVELSDVYEVLDAILQAHGITTEKVQGVQSHRRETRGGFRKRLCLLWTEER